MPIPKLFLRAPIWPLFRDSGARAPAPTIMAKQSSHVNSCVLYLGERNLQADDERAWRTAAGPYAKIYSRQRARQQILSFYWSRAGPDTHTQLLVSSRCLTIVSTVILVGHPVPASCNHIFLPDSQTPLGRHLVGGIQSVSCSCDSAPSLCTLRSLAPRVAGCLCLPSVGAGLAWRNALILFYT